MPDSNNLVMIGMVVILGGFMYFSGRKRKKAAAELAGKVAVGAKVMLTSGIYGEITEMADDRVSIKCSGTTTLEVARGAVLRVIENAPAEKPAAKKAVAPKAAKPAAAKKPVTKK
jgi:preprotein translocase subunit YajC